MSRASRRAEREAAVSDRIRGLEARVEDAVQRLRLYQMVEGGYIDMDDSPEDRIESLKAEHDSAAAALMRRETSNSAMRGWVGGRQPASKNGAHEK